MRLDKTAVGGGAPGLPALLAHLLAPRRAALQLLTTAELLETPLGAGTAPAALVTRGATRILGGLLAATPTNLAACAMDQKKKGINTFSLPSTAKIGNVTNLLSLTKPTDSVG